MIAVTAFAQAPACGPAAAGHRRGAGTVSRRSFVSGLVKVTAAGASLLQSVDEASDALTAAPMSRSLSRAIDVGSRQTRQGSVRRTSSSGLGRSSSLARSGSLSVGELASSALPFDSISASAGSKASRKVPLPLPPVVPPTQLPALKVRPPLCPRVAALGPTACACAGALLGHFRTAL